MRHRTKWTRLVRAQVDLGAAARQILQTAEHASNNAFGSQWSVHALSFATEVHFHVQDVV